MKKFLFLGLAAMLALTSCNQDETVAVAQNGAIGFDVAADKATRSVVDPSITTQTIQDFAVYGFMNDATGVLFNDELVTRGGTGWTYTNTQYWIEGNNYYFAALAPAVDRNWELTTVASGDAAMLGVGTVKFTNEAGKQDLLYWANGPIAGKASGNPAVSVLFNHLLSKVKFSFVNEFDNNSVSLRVSDIKINGLEKVATIDLATNNWWTNADAWAFEANGETVDFNFGAASATAETTADEIAQYQEVESYNELLVFPHSSRDYNVTFTVDLYVGAVLAETYNHTIAVPVHFEMGKSYDLKATLNSTNVDPEQALEPIEFTVVVKDWVEAGEVEVPGMTSTEDALLKAIEDAQDGRTVTLAADVTLTNTLTISKNITLNLNGKTIVNRLGNTATDCIVVAEGATLTITGEGSVEAVTGNDGYAVIADGTVNINGGTFRAGKDATGETNAVVYVRGNGKAYVNGGIFPNTNNSGFVLNKKDADRANTTIEVKGGSFYGFDPANNAAEGAGTNFVATGYKSVYDANTGYYTVVKE